MKAMRKKSLKEYLRRKHSFAPGSRWNRERYRLDLIDETLEGRGYAANGKAVGPGLWAWMATKAAHHLNILAETTTEEEYQYKRKRIERTAERLADVVVACCHKAVAACREYRSRGVDPQSGVTVNPKIQDCREAIRKFEEWKNKKRTGADQ